MADGGAEILPAPNKYALPKHSHYQPQHSRMMLDTDSIIHQKFLAVPGPRF